MIKLKELLEKAPKGWEGTVKSMKKDKDIDNPWALAHWMKKKGYKSRKKESVNEAKVKRFWVFRKDVPKVNKLLYHYFDKNFKFDKMKKLSNGKEAGFYNVAGGYDKIMRVLDRLDKANIHWVVPMGNESVIEGIAIVQEGITKYHIRLTKTPGWYGIWDKNGKQKAEGDRKYITKFLKALKTRMGSFQLKSLVDLATDRKGKDISFDVVESINEELTDSDIKVGDAYKTTHTGNMIEFVYGKAQYGGWQTIEYQFKPQYGASGFMSVGSGPAKSVDGWGKYKKVKVTSKMKKEMIKTLEDAMKSKYKNSEEVDTLVRNGLRLSNVLSWVKRL